MFLNEFKNMFNQLLNQNFEKIKVCLWMTLLSVYLCFPLINLWMPEPIFMKVGMYTMIPELISTAYFINRSHQSVNLYVSPPPLVTR
jgi:hypothetical protein